MVQSEIQWLAEGRPRDWLFYESDRDCLMNLTLTSSQIKDQLKGLIKLTPLHNRQLEIVKQIVTQ